MGAWGAFIMGFFGAVFATVTLYWQLHVIRVAVLLPFVVFVLIALVAGHVLRLPGTGLVRSRAADRAIAWSSAAEGVGLFLAANIVINVHRPDLLLPAMALVVGLHFLPIARAAGFRPFYLLGLSLVLAAAAGFILGGPMGGSISGFAAALGLWTAACAALLRDKRAKQAELSVV